jgi:hypothetical protein
MYAIEAKTRNMFDFEETARRLEGLKRFVLVEEFEQERAVTQRELEGALRVREDLGRYLPMSGFEKYQI